MSARQDNRQASGVRRLGTHDTPALLEFLRAGGPHNAFCLGWVERYGIVPQHEGHAFEFLGVVGRDGVVGAVLLAGGSSCCVTAMDEAVAHQLGWSLRELDLPLRSLVGPDLPVARIWGILSLGQRVARFDRRQTFFTLVPRALRYYGESALRLATIADESDLMAASLRMHKEETNLSISSHDASIYARSVQAKIEDGHIWCVRDEASGVLVFKASLAMSASGMSQIEGVWVHPEHRRLGIARRCVSELCRRVLMSCERVTLYANEGNAAALRLYTRLGFRSDGHYRTVYTDLN